MAVLSLSLGKESVIIEKAQGLSAASPTPTPIRATARVTKLRAMLQTEVARLQKTTPMTMMLRRLRRSASAPIGSPNRV